MCSSLFSLYYDYLLKLIFGKNMLPYFTGGEIMLEYFKRKFFNINRKIEIDTYPKYYEEKDCIIREEKDGMRYIVTLDKNHKEITMGVYND